jgi:polyphosphate kinase
VVGRFLEHSRVFYFENGGEPEMFCASADWMERNFFRRVEIAFPILRDSHRERILRDLDLCLRDNVQAWELQSDGSYKRVERRPDEKPLIAQNELLGIYAAGSNPIFT